MKTGNGKIANLPAEIRDELNYRLADGEQGTELVAWLNANPQVIKVIQERFDGTPISEQNLSEWRKRGYQKWLAFHNFIDESNALSDNTADIAATGIDCDKLLLTLTAAYAEAIQNWIITPGEQMLYKLAVYKNLTNGVIALQRAELQKVRLEIARERLELLREKRGNKSASSSGLSNGTASSPETVPASHQNNSEGRSRDGGIIEAFRRAQGPEPAEGLRHSSAPATRPNSSAHPVIRRPNDPPNTLYGIPIVRNLTVRPAPCMASGFATQATSYNPLAAPKPSAPKVVPSRPIPHR